jgi:hypothetical protein
VNAICDDDDIKAISFVGSNVVSYLILVCFFILLIFCDLIFYFLYTFI